MIDRKARAKKIRRLRSGGIPTLVDLFSGCGGLSLGFNEAGFEIVSAVEIDPLAAASHWLNFHGKLEGTAPEKLAKDITLIDPEDLVAEFASGIPIEEAVDVIVGGPPCQAFARVGRAKLREVHDHPTAFKQDPRGNLYLRYLEYVERLQPLALLMENVPDAINYGGHNIAEETCELLSSMGYVCAYTTLNSVFYGVPQTRERMFLVAYSDQLNVQVCFPRPTHWISLPKGYEGTRQVALKHVLNNGHTSQMSLLDTLSGYYVEPPQPSSDLRPAVTVMEAIHDLPPITSHLDGTLRRGARRLDEFARYRAVRPSAYEEKMRKWPRFESAGGVCDHTIRSLSERDFEIFRRMRPGDQYPQAHAIAMQILEEELQKLTKSDRKHSTDSSQYEDLKSKTVPPYDHQKFPNKWRKMTANEPARTLMAHLGKDSYSHIHYDSAQARTISVREAARLMSFPDGFRFVGTMNPAFRQIGNAVPPLMAAALARTMKSALTGQHAKKNRT